MAEPALDDTDLAIIAELQQDGRRTNQAIGEVVGLSEAAVRGRVNRLLAQGVIRIAAITDPVLLGRRMRANVGIEVDGPTAAVKEAIAAIEEIDYAVVVAGPFDIMVEIQCRDDQHLRDVVDRQLRAIPGVRRTTTFIYLDFIKLAYTWPPGSGRDPS